MKALPAVLAVTLLALSACSSHVDTRVSPDPPPTYAPLRHPFRDAVLYHDPDSAGARWQAANGQPAWLDVITSTPQAIWLTSPQDLERLPAVARRARAEGSLIVLVAYYIPDRGCTGRLEGAPSGDAYLAWTDNLVNLLGPMETAIILEPDAMSAECFNPERARLLREAVHRLSSAGHSVYIDAGHPRWRSTGEAAERLLASGIDVAEGFAVNVSNRQTTQESQAWGLELSDLVGDREFVIDTSRNGVGPPPDDPDRDDEWCNPAHQGLGTLPTTRPNLERTAALLWIKRPGESDGLCGGETTYDFSPAQARTLIANGLSLP